MSAIPAGRGRWRRSSWILLVAWLVSLVPAVLLGLHATAIAPLSWSDVPLPSLQPVASASYATPLQSLWMSSTIVGESPGQVFEDARLLPCPNAPDADIVQSGAGRFRLADRWVFLSSTDNTDPRTNGRAYRLRWPTPPRWWLAWSCAGVALAGTLIAFGRKRREIVQAFRAPSLLWCAFVVIAAVAAHRWWVFADAPLPAIHPDSDSYYALARTIGTGEWPHFEIRPPAYPVFLKTALTATQSVYGVILLQTLLTIASAISVVVGVYRLKPALAPGAALAMAVFTTGLWPLEHDTAVLSETLYANCIVLGTGLLIVALASQRAAIFAVASAAYGLAILTRPAGLFLLAPFVLTLGFLLWNRRPTRLVVAFAAPLPALLLLLSTYNYVNAGVFAVTAWGEANLAVASFTMWDTQPAYPEEINTQIREIRAIIQGQLSDEERAALASSWDPDRLAPIFVKGFYQPALDRASRIGDTYLESRQWIRRISLDSIWTHRTTYAKFVWAMAYLFYVKNITYRADFADFVMFRYQGLFDPPPAAQPPNPIRAELLEFVQDDPPPTLRSRPACATGNTLTIEPTTARRVHRLVQKLRDLSFARSAWVYAFFVVLASAVIRLLATRGRHVGAFTVAVLGASAIGAGLIVCLVEYANFRYSYPTEFVYFLTIALAPLPWLDLRRDAAAS